MCRNTSTWEAGLTTCLTGRDKRSGVMGPTIKETFLMARNMGKDSISFLMDAHIRGFSSKTNSTDKAT